MPPIGNGFHGLTVIILIALGGAMGGWLRYRLSESVARRIGDAFPWGTLVVNVTGAAIMGVIAAGVGGTGEHAIDRSLLWAWLGTGLLGSYTTVSSFSLQTLALIRDGQTLRGLVYVLMSLVMCLFAAASGYWATTEMTGR